MNPDVTRRNVIEELDKAFPEFVVYLGDNRETMKDNPSVYLTFFGIFTLEHYVDKPIQIRIAAFMERMQNSRDMDFQFLFEDFLLDLYSAYEDRSLNVQPFLHMLSPPV